MTKLILNFLLITLLLSGSQLGFAQQQPDEKTISEKYRSYIAPYQKKMEDYAHSNAGFDSTFFSIFRDLIRKKLAFIKQNIGDFSFGVFDHEISRISFPARDPLIDSLKIFYETTFPEQLRQSTEGKKIEANLHSVMVGTHDHIMAPDFISRDIRGNPIRLIDYRGRYVLLNLWATWCGPCMAELPAITLIRNKYPKDSLALISVSYDSDSTAFLKAISQHHMNWIHIYRDKGLADLYGSRGLPMLLLIDPSGTIIYNRAAGKETDYEKLSLLNDVLKKEFSH